MAAAGARDVPDRAGAITPAIGLGADFIERFPGSALAWLAIRAPTIR
jgi:hypothetical protein